jgi:hypothetical protein
MSLWDQNAALARTSPATAVVESVASDWLLDLLGLPKTARARALPLSRRRKITARR